MVGCDGPCSVDGRRVTPTATGPITIHIELIRPERTWRDDRRLDVVAADGFWITGCGNLAVHDGAPEIRKPIATDDVLCVVGQPPIELGVLAGGVGFAVPIELAGATVTGPLDRAAITAALGLTITDKLRYTLDPSASPPTLVLEGTWRDRPLRVELHRDGPSLLMTRGFRWVNEYPFNR